MRYLRLRGEAQIIAELRRANSPEGWGAALLVDISAPDLDGMRLTAVITDTIDGYRDVEVLVPRLEALDEATMIRIESAIERAAGLRDREQDCPLDAAAARFPLNLAPWLEES